MIVPHNRPTVGQEEADAVADVLRSGWLAQGERVRSFENEMCRYNGFPEGSAVAVSSGTAALFLALRALRVEKKEVIVPTYVCSAVLNAVYRAGANPVLVDIEPDTLNLSFDDVKRKVSRKTATIIVTHTFGMPARTREFTSLGVPVVEDCAQALGARFDGKLVGLEGTVSVFSFYASKMITTGYGGMLLSRDKAIIEDARDYREFDGREDYIPRFNVHLSDMNAALGSVQLRRLPQFLQRRRDIAERYKRALSGRNIWPPAGEGKEPNFYRILVRTEDAQSLKEHLESKGISSIVPVERFELLHRYLGQDAASFPASESLVGSTLSLPAYPGLSDEAHDTVCRAVEEYFSNA